MPIFDHFSLLAPLYEKFIPARIPELLFSFLELPVNGMVLDAGGGTGRLAQFMLGKADGVIVADESLAMTLQSRQKSGLHPTCAQTERLPFRDQTFARIIMVDALHHVAHQAETVRELWRVLSPGGLLVIEEPDIRNIVVKGIALAEKLALMRSHFLSPCEIEALLPFRDAQIINRSQNGSAWIVARKKEHL